MSIVIFENLVIIVVYFQNTKFLIVIFYLAVIIRIFIYLIVNGGVHSQWIYDLWILVSTSTRL